MDTRRYDPRRARAAAMVLALACLPLPGAVAAGGEAAAGGAAGGGAAAGGPGSPGRESVNLVVILDVSTSMRGAFASMQDYIHGSVVGKILKTGDYFRLYTFGVEVRSVYSGTVELPRDDAALRDLIYAMKPDEEGTDIGLMLAELDRFLRAERLPNPLTSVVWATDGKNDPPRGSPYAGKDVFDPKAFSAYSILKSAEYKVLLLSIGSNTAAKDLAGPMGGDYLEVGRDVTAAGLEAAIGDLTSSVGLAAADRPQRVSGSAPRLRVEVSSSYAQARELTLEQVRLSIDGAPAADALAAPRTLALPAKSSVGLEVPIPRGLARGAHSAEVELVAAGGGRLGPPRRLEFSYEPGASPLVVSILAVLIGIAAACFLVGSSRRV